MCNIAGYIGKREAAPILIEMMRREEGYGGGYYTGMTVHDGERLHTDKVLGDLSHLLAETNCADFRGTVGFIHSRSKSGGGVGWGHPFTTKGGETSLIANGAAGCFLTPEMKQKRCDAAVMLEGLGYEFGSRTHGAVGDYPALSDGTAIHSSDLLCQYAAYLCDGGLHPTDALCRTMSTLPCEAVVLMMRKEHARSIFLSRISYPMHLGIAEDGDIYLATTPLAFPEDVAFRSVTLLPPLVGFEATDGECRVTPYRIEVGREVAPITEEVLSAVAGVVLRGLAGESAPVSLGAVEDYFKDTLPPDPIPEVEPIAYIVMQRLLVEGRIKVVPTRDEGPFPGYSTVRFYLQLT